MEYELVISCDECTIERRKKDKYWSPTQFFSLTDAVAHIKDTTTIACTNGHNIRIELEAKTGSGWED